MRGYLYIILQLSHPTQPREEGRGEGEEADKFWDQRTEFKESVRMEPKLSATTPLPFFRGQLRGATGNYGYTSKEQLMLWGPTLMEAHTQARALVCLVLVPPLVFGSLSFQSPI